MSLGKEELIDIKNNNIKEKTERLNQIKIDIFDRFFNSVEHNKTAIFKNSVNENADYIRKLGQQIKSLEKDIVELETEK